MILAIFVFIVMLLVLVLVHEWGHYAAAKKVGCNVEEFGFGFPPRVASFVRGGTRFSFNLLPIGGFVKIEGENMNEVTYGPGSFASKSAAARIFVLAAGVLMNVVLAYVLFSVQAAIGTPTLATDEAGSSLQDIQTYILDVAANSPAEAAGLQSLDRVIQVNGSQQPTITDIQRITAEAKGQPLQMEVERAGQHITLQVTPRVNPPEGEGALGISLSAAGLQRVVWWKAPWAGAVKTWQTLTAMIAQFGILIQQLVSSGSAGGQVTGPIGIAVYTNEATRMGLPYILEFAALISLNLAVINILPLPALDGGRILFVFLEVILRRRLPAAVESWVHGAGFALLIGLMILITLKDIRHYF